MNDKHFLSVKDLYVEYTSDGRTIHAVNGVSFNLERGKTLGLVGETGAGKTTIAKAIIGILPDPPAKVKSGEIILDGETLLNLNEVQMRKIRGGKISMVFQDPMTALNPTMRVGQQIAEVIKYHHADFSKSQIFDRARQMLEMVGIPAERYKEYPHQFSGGMKQRVVIAMALACNPQLLLADEPTTALDVTIQAQVLDMIGELKEKMNTSMILITHDLGVIAENCDNVAVIYAGEIVEYGTLEDIFDNPSHPYTIGLFAALPSMAGHVHRLTPIEGLPPDPSALPSGCHFSPRCPYASERCRQEKADMINIGGEHLCRCMNIDAVKPAKKEV